jgi:hypothetical protein
MLAIKIENYPDGGNRAGLVYSTGGSAQLLWDDPIALELKASIGPGKTHRSCDHFIQHPSSQAYSVSGCR